MTTPRLALITGASSGIGEAFANLLSAKGYALALAARNEAELDRVATAVNARHGRMPAVVPIDLAAADGTARLAEALETRILVPDVVINNAGFGLMGRATSINRDSQLGMIDLNVRALTDLTLRYLPTMLAQARGGVINIASTAAFLPGPGMAVYFATKAYVVSFTDALAEETKGRGVTVMSLCPGPVATGFQARAGMRDMRARPMPSMLTAAEVAEAGWSAFERGARMEVPGMLNKLTAYGTRGMPRRLLLPLTRRATAAMKGL